MSGDNHKQQTKYPGDELAAGWIRRLLNKFPGTNELDGAEGIDAVGETGRVCLH